MIYRIAEAADGSAAQRQGCFASPDLAAEGFIHFAERYQDGKHTKRGLI